MQALVKDGLAQEDSDFDYKLVGVVIHMGVADAGHYISYVNIERENDPTKDLREWVKTDKQTWLEFNDSVVSAFDFGQMQYKAFGEEERDNSGGMIIDYTSNVNDVQDNNAQSSHNAYMLVYEKAHKKPLKVVCAEETL